MALTGRLVCLATLVAALWGCGSDEEPEELLEAPISYAIVQIYQGEPHCDEVISEEQKDENNFRTRCKDSKGKEFEFYAVKVQGMWIPTAPIFKGAIHPLCAEVLAGNFRGIEYHTECQDDQGRLFEYFSVRCPKSLCPNEDIWEVTEPVYEPEE